MTSLQNQQSNALMAGLIILAAGLLERNKYLGATLCLVASVYVKLFGVVGFALFLLYPRRKKLALYTLFWAAALGAAPLIFVSPAQYGDLLVSYWNMLAQDHAVSAGVSIMGVLNPWLGGEIDKNFTVLIGAIIFMLPFCRRQSFADLRFRMLLLSSVLLWVIIFNHRSESPTMIIAVAGAAIWFMASAKNLIDRVLLVAVLSITSLAVVGVGLWYGCGEKRKIYPGLFVALAVIVALVAPDIFPPSFRRQYITPYAIKAVPCILIWLKLTCDLLAGKFSGAGEIKEPLMLRGQQKEANFYE
ncbi:MAG: DUF2029 domain-containing protein [Planctomycetota bacterium]|jgi:hypothetical protein|nr:DUF2029 domain-containing protein [Planctomycetota bacterium]